MARKPVNPYASVGRITQLSRTQPVDNSWSKPGLNLQIPELEDNDLAALAENPEVFLADSANRAKIFGIPANTLKAKLAKYGEREGIDPHAMIKKLLTEIDW